MSGSRIVVTGVAGPLGRSVAERLIGSDPELVVGIAAAPVVVPSGVELVVVSVEHRVLSELLIAQRIDTIIHAGWWSSGRGARAAHDHVIRTMGWASAAAAARREGVVRSFVMASPASVYPTGSNTPRFHPEREALRPAAGSIVGSLAEAEQFVRDLATSNPHLTASILRLADLVGCEPPDQLASVLGRQVVPAVWGFDPEMQFLHLDDAAAALEHAAQRALAGLYNVGASGTLRWRQAIRLRRRSVGELPPLPDRPLAAVLRLTGFGTGDDGLVDVLRFGRCLDTDAITRTGFLPSFTSEECVARLSEPHGRPTQPRPGFIAHVSDRCSGRGHRTARK